MSRRKDESFSFTLQPPALPFNVTISLAFSLSFQLALPFSFSLPVALILELTSRIWEWGLGNPQESRSSHRSSPSACGATTSSRSGRCGRSACRGCILCVCSRCRGRSLLLVRFSHSLFSTSQSFFLPSLFLHFFCDVKQKETDEITIGIGSGSPTASRRARYGAQCM